jgi:hypothetical protein
VPKTLRRIALSTICVLALVVAGSIPASASVDLGRAKIIAAAQHSKKKPTVCDKASRLRRAVIKKYTRIYTQQYDNKKKGRKRARDLPGRDICIYGASGGKKASPKLKLKYLYTLRRMKSPPVVVAPVAEPAPQAAPVTAVPSSQQSSTGSSSALPACASESGTNYSTGPNNTNPSGATGRYQEMPVHRQAGGLCYGIDLSPGGQDRCAELIYEAQGAGAWVGCG